MMAFVPTPYVLAFMGLGPSEMLLVAVIALLLFGSDLPNVARTWGKTINEFRRHLSGIRDELNEAIYAEPEPPRRLQYHPEFHRTGNGSPESAALPGGDTPSAATATSAAPPDTLSTTTDAVDDAPAEKPDSPPSD